MEQWKERIFLESKLKFLRRCVYRSFFFPKTFSKQQFEGTCIVLTGGFKPVFFQTIFRENCPMFVLFWIGWVDL